MEKSIAIGEIAKALNKFQSEMSAVKKDGVNPYFKSKYATLENIIETIKEPLKNSGLSFAQLPFGENELSTIIMHISGEFIQSTVKMSPKDNTPQGQGSAITYMRRYALSSALGIATEEDDDGNSASGVGVKNTIVKDVSKENRAKLEAVKNVEELKKVWAELPAQSKTELKDLKEQLKQKYENA